MANHKQQLIVKQADQITASDVDLSHIEDGAYIGEYILSPVKVMVEVIIRNNTNNIKLKF